MKGQLKCMMMVLGQQKQLRPGGLITKFMPWMCCKWVNTDYIANIYNMRSLIQKKDRATLQGKFNKLVNVKILLCSCFFIDVLAPAKIFSLQTQKSDVSIIDIVDCVDTTKWNYKKLLKPFESDQNNVFVLLPMWKTVINKIENNEDGEPEYQGQKLKFYLSEKEYLKNHFVDIIKTIVVCYEESCSSLL